MREERWTSVVIGERERDVALATERRHSSDGVKSTAAAQRAYSRSLLLLSSDPEPVFDCVGPSFTRFFLPPLSLSLRHARKRRRLLTFSHVRFADPTTRSILPRHVVKRHLFLTSFYSAVVSPSALISIMLDFPNIICNHYS